MKRLHIDVTQSMSDEVDKVKAETGLSTANIFRFAFNVFRLVLRAKQAGQKVTIDKDGKEEVEIVLPI